MAAVPGSPARPRPLGPPRAQASGRGAGTPNLGRDAAPLSRDRGARERHGCGQTAGADRGDRRRLVAPELLPGPRQERELFSKDSNFPPSPAGCGPSCFGIVLRNPAGALGRDRLPRIPRRRLRQLRGPGDPERSLGRRIQSSQLQRSTGPGPGETLPPRRAPSPDPLGRAAKPSAPTAELEPAD